MSRFGYYERMKILARDVRSRYGLITPEVRLSDLRRIYKEYEIKIDLWKPRLPSVQPGWKHMELRPKNVFLK